MTLVIIIGVVALTVLLLSWLMSVATSATLDAGTDKAFGIIWKGLKFLIFYPLTWLWEKFLERWDEAWGWWELKWDARRRRHEQERKS